MGEVHYMISEASKRVNVETHVLRYWEEELELSIGRTEMGHRYYTEDDVQLFNCIKELKEQGMLLKDLKAIIPDMIRTREKRKLQRQEEAVPEKKRTPLEEALLKNNKLLETAISTAVSKAVITEMDFLFQAKERQEEERYKKLDTLIRQQQAMRRESSKVPALRNLRQLFDF